MTVAFADTCFQSTRSRSNTCLLKLIRLSIVFRHRYCNLFVCYVNVVDELFNIKWIPTEMVYSKCRVLVECFLDSRVELLLNSVYSGNLINH